MATHGSERWVNVKASMFAHVASLAVAGAPAWTFEGQPRAQAHTGPWGRVVLRQVGEDMSGLWDASNRASRLDLLLAVDLFWPDGSEAQLVDTYALDRAADDVVAALRYADVALLDYAADPESPATLAGHAIRIDLPTRSERTHSPGYDRVQILAPAYLHLRSEL